VVAQHELKAVQVWLIATVNSAVYF